MRSQKGSQEGSQARHSSQKCTTHLSCPPSSSRAAVGDRWLPVAPPSTPVPSGYAGLQGRICIHQGPPAPNKGLQWLHKGVPSLSPLLFFLSPTVVANTHTCAEDRPRAQPQCCSMGATAVGDMGQGHVRHHPVSAHCPLTAHTDLLALPHCHILLQSLLQQPRVPCSLQQHSRSDSGATTAGHRGPCVTSATAARTWRSLPLYRAGEADKRCAGTPLHGTQ